MVVDSRLRLAYGLDDLRSALRTTLAGGPPVAPLPSASAEREAALAMLQPELPVSEPDAAAVVSTSGSTGQPKGVVLTRAALTAAVEATHDRLGGPADWTLALPPHYVAGLMVVARTLVAGTRLVTADPRLTDLEVPTERRYLALVPTQLERALTDDATTAAVAGHAAVLLGGAPATTSLLDRARAAGITVVTTYGMSETCGGCVYDGRPLPGVAVDIDPASARISLAGPMVFAGYRLRPALTAAVLTSGRLLTQDRGHWESDRLVVDGRVDDVVISGGMNVDLAAVERAARGSTGGELAVVGLPDAEWGTAVVVVTEGSGTLADLRADLAGRLPAYALPRRLVRTRALPRTSSGKIDRQRLIRALDEGAPELEEDS